MNNKSKIPSIIVRVILFILLLPWPVYVILSYNLFSGTSKYIAILVYYILEIFIGINLTMHYLKSQKSEPNKRLKAKMIILLIALGIYVLTSGIYIIKIVAQ